MILQLAIEACKAAIEYDKAIESCAGDPEKMSSFCTAQGDNLDTLYYDWITKAKQTVEKWDNWLTKLKKLKVI